MTIAIIDDEPINRLVLKKIITLRLPTEKIIAEDGNIDTSVIKINTLKPELVLLDIELKNGTGFDIISRLNYAPQIIFTTAYEKYAIQAIKAQAADYILKPINENELIVAINKCKHTIETYNTKHIQKNVSADILAYTTSDEKRFYSYRTSTGKKTINFDEIYFFESSGSYTFVITDDEKIILSKNIGEIEKDLVGTNFYRTHNSFIINKLKIKSIDTKRNGIITLLNGELIPLSQRKVKSFFDFMENS